jgi:hypothetical protein
MQKRGAFQAPSKKNFGIWFAQLRAKGRKPNEVRVCACTVKHVRLAWQESFLTIGDAAKQCNAPTKGILYGSHKKCGLPNQADQQRFTEKQTRKAQKLYKTSYRRGL